MTFSDIRYKGRVLRPMKATVRPAFEEETVLVSDPWDFVDLWLKRNKHEKARSYWVQAQDFAHAAGRLPTMSAPLPAYYCLLNATKALLEVNGRNAAGLHGVAGARDDSRTSLANEMVHFKSGGVLAGLCGLLGEPRGNSSYSLKDVLYNLSFIHRAFTVTYSSAKDLFIPIKRTRFVRKDGSKEAWFCAEVESRYATKRTTKKLPRSWEFDVGAGQGGTIRFKKRFVWDGGHPSSPANQKRLAAYHRKVRSQIHYIHGTTRLWYLKRGKVGNAFIPRSGLSLTFGAMHRLSELSRYDPFALRGHLDRQHNWLLAEFVESAVGQFIDQVASEITGRDLMVPGIRK